MMSAQTRSTSVYLSKVQLYFDILFQQHIFRSCINVFHCITEMRIRFVKLLQHTVAHADGMVTLRCEVCKPKADVQWLKNGVEIVPSRRFSIRADGVERSLTIHRLSHEDAGDYSCESRDDRTTASLRVESKYTWS